MSQLPKPARQNAGSIRSDCALSLACHFAICILRSWHGNLSLLSPRFGGWRGARPYDPAKGPRMIPWQPIMLLAATGVIVMIIRIAHELGLTP